MPYGTPPDGADAIVFVGTSSPAATPVGGLINWKDSEPSPTTERHYYMQPSITAVGKSSKTLTLACDYEEGDSGQAIIFAARIAKTAIFALVAPGGVNGEETSMRVSQQDVTGPDADGFSTIDWTLAQVAAPTLAGSGYGG